MVCLRHWYYRSSLAAASAVGFSRFQQRRRHFKLTSFARFLSHDSGYKPSWILDFLYSLLLFIIMTITMINKKGFGGIGICGIGIKITKRMKTLNFCII